MDAEIAPGQQRGRPFAKGQSGNPAGRPKGARNRATMAAEALLDGQAEALTRKAVEMALAGDTTALRLCLERLMPPRKDRPIVLPLPPLTGPDGVAGAIGAILAAVADGRVTPGEAVALAGLIEAQRRATAPNPPALPTSTTLQIRFVEPAEGGRA